MTTFPPLRSTHKCLLSLVVKQFSQASCMKLRRLTSPVQELVSGEQAHNM